MTIFNPKKYMLPILCCAVLGGAGEASAQNGMNPANVEESTLNQATPAARPSQTLPLLNFQIDRKTDRIHLINTNNDPYVYTRVYRLKHADPYEIRPYIMSAVRSRRVTANDTKVEAIKYADGTGMLLISAEEYRFDKQENGMTIGELVAALDRPKIESEAGRKFFVYYAKYFDAVSLAKLIYNVGIQHALDETELGGGIDTVRPDPGLNAIFFYCTPTSEKTIRKMLGEYDAPTTEALITYTVYEMYNENDGNLGIDYQAWKNGMGADLFAAGAAYVSGLPIDAANVVKDAHANYINFNPRWNSKFLDFLVAKSKAKVITSGTMSVMNKCAGTVSCVTRFPVIGDAEEEVPGTPATTEIAIENQKAVVTKNPATEASTRKNYKIRKTRNSEYGFNLNITPEVNGKASILELSMTNTSLVGFKSDGTPRTAKTDLATKLMVGNDNQTFYVGGLDKTTVVRSADKLPFLGDIPGLGFLFAGETEQLKKSRIVTVLHVKLVDPNTELAADYRKSGKDVREKISNYGTKAKYYDENDYGFGQYLIDSDKK